jgi:hypothetical protein
VVKSVIPAPAGKGSRSKIRLRSAFYRLSGDTARSGAPPQKARGDLLGNFKLAVVYSGSGSESMSYEQTYRSVCSGGGGFVEQETDAVSPSWKVRYVVDLDHLLSAVRGPDGVDIVPQVSYGAAGSRLKAVEQRQRTYVDNGCFSNPTGYRCTTTFHLQSKGADADFALDPGVGAEVGIPTRTTSSGRCDPSYYTLGPSLWDSGAANALVAKLGLVNTRLPARPYSPIAIRWPGGSALQQEGFLAGPCQGLASTCHDTFKWKGTVRLQPAG